MKRALIALMGVLFATSAVAQSAPAGPVQLLQSRDWNALSSRDAKGKICYVISKPQTMEPATLNHGDVFFFISTRPAEKVTNEPSLRVGYSFKQGTTVSVDIDGKVFTLFTTGDGAWLQDAAEEARLVDALRKGRAMKASGTSGRGNTTNYAFSLAGISGALDAAAKECR